MSTVKSGTTAAAVATAASSKNNTTNDGYPPVSGNNNNVDDDSRIIWYVEGGRGGEDDRAKETTTKTTRATTTGVGRHNTSGNSTNSNHSKGGVTIILPEQKGNAIHLHTAVRKYTGATLSVLFDEKTRHRQNVIQVELWKLYDALGLLRSLQYDIQGYNACFHRASSLSSSASMKYNRFRLTRQAAAFGVRLGGGSPPQRATGGADRGDNDTQDMIVVVPGLDSLIEYIEQEYMDVSIATARSNLQNGLVDFDSLAEYCTPGTVLVDHGVATGIAHIGAPTLFRVRACFYARGQTLLQGTVVTFHVALETVVAAGNDQFLVVEYQQLQSHFVGTRSISSGSNVMDMFTLPSDQLVRELTKRGEQYRRLCGGDKYDNNVDPVGVRRTVTATTTTGSGQMVQYSAGSFLPVGGGGHNKTGRGGGGASLLIRSGGRMMVDTIAAWSRGVNCAGVLNGTASAAIIGSLKLYQQTRVAAAAAKNSNNTKYAPTSLEYSTAGGGGWIDDGDDSHDLLVLPGPSLSPELLALAWPVVPGFSLAARTWGVALVHGLSPIRYDDTVFDKVVLPPSRKKLIQALVASHQSSSSLATGEQRHNDDDNQNKPIMNADLIAGKGEGSIFLLYGPPGVGKTLTAEAIAEMLHKPLYVVSMGELGTTPESLEGRLQDIFDLCSPWQALVLIDEAEMFLERRSKNDLVRNAMVCVMLRLLEYYNGILFLTTNRVESLDPAFQSRVTCALRYDPLTVEARLQIWTTMLRRLNIDITNIDVAELARADINGRQIKNTLQLATALARHDHVPVGQAHLHETLAVTTSFLRETSTTTTNFALTTTNDALSNTAVVEL